MGKRATAGGQAVMEGVMMRAGDRWALAVRRPDGGIHVEAHELPSSATGAWSWPVLRGMAALGSSVSLGMRALGSSVEIANPAGGKQGKNEASVAMVLGSVLAIALFVVLPAVLTRLLGLNPADQRAAFGAVDGILRLAILFGYVFAISRLGYVRRVFAYHGAEHKSIHAWEAGDELTVENARKYPREHPRCGTSFLFLVTLVAFLVYLAVPTGWLVTTVLGVPAASTAGNLLALLLRVFLLPLVAGVAYEVLRAVGKHSGHPLARLVSWPGLRLQGLTTAEPDDGMLEVALASLTAATGGRTV